MLVLPMAEEAEREEEEGEGEDEDEEEGIEFAASVLQKSVDMGSISHCPHDPGFPVHPGPSLAFVLANTRVVGLVRSPRFSWSCKLLSCTEIGSGRYCRGRYVVLTSSGPDLP